MAKGNWRNWDEIRCECGWRAYRKDYKNIKKCLKCGGKIIHESA